MHNSYDATFYLKPWLQLADWADWNKSRSYLLQTFAKYRKKDTKNVAE